MGLEIETPLYGTGSLKIIQGISDAASHGNMHLSTFFDVGFSRGKLRTLLQTVIKPTGILDVHLTGLAFMQSNLNTQSANYYTFGYGVVEGEHSSGGLVFALLKVTGGVPAVLFALEDEDAANNRYFPIEVEWNLDINELGGLRITSRRGQANSTSFATLEEINDRIDVSPFTVTEGEGIVFLSTNGEDDYPATTWLIDRTSIFELQ